jgi:hypothetical protein
VQGVLDTEHFVFVNGKLVIANPEESSQKEVIRNYVQDRDKLEHPQVHYTVKYKIVSPREIKGGLTNNEGIFVSWDLVRIKDTKAYDRLKKSTE